MNVCVCVCVCARAHSFLDIKNHQNISNYKIFKDSYRE